MVGNEIIKGVNILIGDAARSTCAEADENNDGVVMIGELIRGRTANQTSCNHMFPPAGLRGEVRDAVSSARLESANVDVWQWPPPESTGPNWVWPNDPSGSSMPPNATGSTYTQMAASSPHYGFDPIAGACIPQVVPVGFGSGLHRMRLRKTGYQTLITYRLFDFDQQTTTYSNTSCTQKSSRSYATQNFALYANGVAHEALPDILVDPREISDPPAVTCVDLPNHSADPAAFAAVIVAPQGVRDLGLLRVGIRTANVGYGALELDGTSGAVIQRIFSQSGSVSRTVALPNSSFIDHAEHGHIHLNNWAQMLLIEDQPSCSDPAARSATACEVATSDKLSFCVRDFKRFDDEIRAGTPEVYTVACNRLQGMSRGWADIYSEYTRGQFIEVTNTPAGDYWVEALFDPEGQFVDSSGARTELAVDNNRARGPAFSLQQRCESLPSQNNRYRCVAGLPTSQCRSVDCRAIVPDCCQPGLTHDQYIHCGVCQEAYCRLNPNFETNPACRETGNSVCCREPGHPSCGGPG